MTTKLTLRKETLNRLSADSRKAGQGFPGATQAAKGNDRNVPPSLSTHLTQTWG
jgi:hypothetical protein